ncbi:hypothetical protein E2320_006888, partial [Naja naja]
MLGLRAGKCSSRGGETLRPLEGGQIERLLSLLPPKMKLFSGMSQTSSGEAGDPQEEEVHLGAVGQAEFTTSSTWSSNTTIPPMNEGAKYGRQRK